MSCGIYMWISPSEKIYIGQSRNLEHRKSEFESIKKIYTSKNSAIDLARQKYPDFSKWKYCVLEECKEEVLNERERYYIEKYNSFHNGYNSNDGGNFDNSAVVLAAKKRVKKILQYDLDGNLLKIWDSVKDASKELNIEISSLSNAASCTGKKTCCGFQWSWVGEDKTYRQKIKPIKTAKQRIVEAKYKSVIEYDLNGNFIKEWSSIKEASQTLKISHTHISACCLGKRTTAGKFQWKYKGDEQRIIKNIGSSDFRIRKARSKPVLQYSLNGEFIKEWETLTSAEKELKISGISLCANGKILTAGESQWKFKEDGEEPPRKIDAVLPKHVRTAIGKRKYKTNVEQGNNQSAAL